jgi:VanZ family protein
LPEVDGRGTRVTPGGIVLAWGWVGLWLLVILRGSQGDLSAEWSLWSLEPFIRFLGLTPQQAELAHYSLRKGAHLVEYAVLGFLALRAAGLSLPPARAAACALLLCGAVAGADEAHQATLATRTGSPADVGIDLAGAALGLAIRHRSTSAARAARAESPA